MASTGGLAIGSAEALPRLLYIGDVAVADTMAGEALLYRLLQFYPPEKLSVICAMRPGMPTLPGVQYHHWGPAWPRLLQSRLAEEYVLWNAWRYYRVPSAIAHIATAFKAEAILSISHVSAWLAAWQLAARRRLPFHLIAHDDFVYASRFPAWSRPWASKKFGEAYRAAAERYCISDTMAESYRGRFGVDAEVIYPAHKGARDFRGVSARVDRDGPMTFAYGGSINSATDMDQIVSFARAATARGHRIIAFTPQHALLAERAQAASVAIEANAPIHSDDLAARLRHDADCLLLTQSMVDADREWVATAFPSKWADYSTIGIPVLVWAPADASSVRFLREHPGCAELVTSQDLSELNVALSRLEAGPLYRRQLAQALLDVGERVFSPQAGWHTLRSALVRDREPATHVVTSASGMTARP